MQKEQTVVSRKTPMNLPRVRFRQAGMSTRLARAEFYARSSSSSF
jgi:hypothetical protein